MRPLMLAFFVLACSPLSATALDVSLVTGTFIGVPHNFTGNGYGFRMGAFEITNPHTAVLVLNDVTLTAIGSGDDSTALSEIGLFVDSNTNGSYDPGVDTRYGAIYTAYPVDDGSLTFTSSIGFAPAETKRFIIVGKLNGAVLPATQEGFRTIVSSLSATGTAPTGVPTTFNEGVVVINAPTPLTLEYSVSGSGPPYSYSFRLVLDNHDGSWTAGQDWSSIYFGQAVFGAGGTAPFVSWATNSASYPVGMFTATGWANYSVAGINYDCPGLVDNVGPTEWWVPNAIGAQLVWWGTANVFLDEGQMAWSMHRRFGPTVPGTANLEPAKRVGDYLRVQAVAGAVVAAGPAETGGGNGFAIGAFDIIARDNASTLSSITIAASGTGDDSAAFTEIGLFVDANGNGVFDAGVDTRFGAAYTAYPADDGTLTFTDTLSFGVDETRRVLVVAKLNGSTLATLGQTFNTTVTAISATGSMHSGLPTAVIPGIQITPTVSGGDNGGGADSGGGCSTDASRSWFLAALLLLISLQLARSRKAD